MIYKFLILIFCLLITGCSSNIGYDLPHCEDLDFSEYSNVEYICDGLYEGYNDYFNGNFNNYINGTKGDAVDWCILEIYEDYSHNFDIRDACDSFINGGGGFAQLYINELDDYLLKWCDNNFYVSEDYHNCIE